MNNTFPSEEFGIEIQRVTSGFISRLFVTLIPVFFVGIVQGFRHGFHERDYAFLVIGSALSCICAFAYGLVGILEAFGRPKRLWMFPAVWSGFIPYLFIVYLTFYRGVWGIVRLFSSFSIAALVSALAFTHSARLSCHSPPSGHHGHFWPCQQAHQTGSAQ